MGPRRGWQESQGPGSRAARAGGITQSNYRPGGGCSRAILVARLQQAHSRETAHRIRKPRSLPAAQRTARCNAITGGGVRVDALQQQTPCGNLPVPPAGRNRIHRENRPIRRKASIRAIHRAVVRDCLSAKLKPPERAGPAARVSAVPGTPPALQAAEPNQPSPPHPLPSPLPPPPCHRRSRRLHIRFPGGYPNGEESDSKSDAGLPVAGSTPVPSA